MSLFRILCLSVLAIAMLASPGAAQSSSFGNSVVFDGDALIIGEPNNTFRAGMVYVYRKQGDEWVATSMLEAPDTERADGFGAVLALTGDDLFVAQRGGRVHVFQRDGAGWRFSDTIEDERVGLDPRCNDYGYCGADFGMALAAEGDWLLVGEPGTVTDLSRLRPRRGRSDQAEQQDPSGFVFAFQREGGQWVQRQRLESPAIAPGDAFGAAISMVGDRALIGAPNAPGADGVEGAGRVFEYALADGRWTPAGELTVASESNAAFGGSIVAEGDRAIIGAAGAGQGVGAAFTFVREGGDWSGGARVTPPEGTEGDVFGAAVALSGSDMWVGAPVTRGIETGMAFVYAGGGAEPGAPTRIRFTEDRTNTEDSFGHRVVASGSVAAVTASGLDHGAGGVFVFERDASGQWQEDALIVSAPDALGAVMGEERRCSPEGNVELFDCRDIELYSYVPISLLAAPENARGIRTNDNWGWTDPETGKEYALVGRNDGTSFVDITDPANPVLIGDLPKTPNTPRSQLWRDIKTYRDHAFIVADGAGAHGMQVFDLRRLRTVSEPPVVFEPDVLYRGEGTNTIESSHNVIINEDTGFAYLVSGRCGGMHMVDITEPLNPTFAGCAEEGGTHDAQCVIYDGPDQDYAGHEICLRMSGSSFSISDVTDKQNPVQLANATHPNPAYMHQGWLTDDQRYFIMDDESDVIAGNVETTRTLIWDVSDLEDPLLAREFMGSMPASAHNLYIKGDFTYQANYRYGLHILDTSDPLNPREVGFFDTSPYQTGPGFSGAWSTYPYFESGSIIVTSLQEGLFVLKKRRPISER